jgi:hypothetical protein
MVPNSVTSHRMRPGRSSQARRYQLAHHFIQLIIALDRRLLLAKRTDRPNSAHDLLERLIVHTPSFIQLLQPTPSHTSVTIPIDRIDSSHIRLVTHQTTLVSFYKLIIGYTQAIGRLYVQF